MTNLSDALFHELVRELMSRLPAKIGGHEVTTATLSMHPPTGDHGWTVHLRLEDGRRACSGSHMPVETLGELALDDGWALFSPVGDEEPSKLIGFGRVVRDELFGG